MRTLEKQAKNPAVKIILGKTADTVEGGATFAEALAQNSRSFDKLYLNMVRAGEASGAMEVILDRLAGFMEKAARISGKVKSAMIYPCVVLSIAILAIIGLMVFIVPKFQTIFKDLLGPETPMPAITLFVMNFSNSLMTEWWKFVIGIVAVIVLYKITVMIPIGKWGGGLVQVQYAPFRTDHRQDGDLPVWTYARHADGFGRTGALRAGDCPGNRGQ